MKLALNPKNAVEVFLRLDNLRQVTRKDSPRMSVLIRSAGKWDSLIFDFLIGLVHYSVSCLLVIVATKLLLMIAQVQVQVHVQIIFYFD